MIVLRGVLDVKSLERIGTILAAAPFEDGRATSALAAKNNLQVPLDDAASLEAGAIVVERLRAHAEFPTAAFPEAVSQPLFSAYRPGMEYPDHVDVALMGSLRTDLAVTLFLSPLDSYGGGALVADGETGRREIRLPAGDAILYPASTVHHVAPVEHGVRQAAVLWVQSYVRDPEKRAILTDLGRGVAALEGTPCGPYLTRSYWNLLRMWAEPAPAQR
jgi:PKHD-type hydroxylase